MTNTHHLRVSMGALLLATLAASAAFAGPTTDRIRDNNRLRLAYIPQARPFTSAAGQAADGYGAALCGEIASRVKSELALPQLDVEWVPVSLDTAFTTVSSGNADVLCTPSNATLQRRKTVAFSIPAFAGGIRAVVRADAPTALRDVLEATPQPKNVWRGSPALNLVEKTRFATVAGTSSEKWLAGKVSTFKLNTATVSVPDYASGIKYLLQRKIDVFLAERDVVLAAMDDATEQKLVILKRQLTHEPLALALPRGDDDFRLLVDSALASAYSSPQFAAMYSKYFGALDDSSKQFFSWVIPPP